MRLSEFRVQFPEFDAASDAMVQAYLNAAALEISTSVWGGTLSTDATPLPLTIADQGQGYLAAHKLALSPYGQAARLAAKVSTKGSATTTYFEHYDAMRNMVACGKGRIAGDQIYCPTGVPWPPRTF